MTGARCAYRPAETVRWDVVEGYVSREAAVEKYGVVLKDDLTLDANGLSLVALSPNVSYGFTPAQQASGRLGGTRSTLTMSLSGARATWASDGKAAS